VRAQTIDVKAATGRILCSTIFRPGGKKLLAKGHVISEEDARMLETEGLAEVWVTELEDCWRAATPTLAGRQLKLDLIAVSRIDCAGKYLLALLRGMGAELIASGAATREVVERIALDWPGYCGCQNTTDSSRSSRHLP